MDTTNSNPIPYEAPSLVVVGSLADITRACDAPGSGDSKFPDTLHTKSFIDSQNFCTSN